MKHNKPHLRCPYHDWKWEEFSEQPLGLAPVTSLPYTEMWWHCLPGTVLMHVQTDWNPWTLDWNCCWCPAGYSARVSWAAARAQNSPTCGFHIRGSECSPVSSCGSAALQSGSCCAGGHRGWTRAALRLACASLSSSGNHSLEDLWFDQQEKEVSPKTNKHRTRAKSHILPAQCKLNNSEWKDDYLCCHPLNKQQTKFYTEQVLPLWHIVEVQMVWIRW